MDHFKIDCICIVARGWMYGEIWPEPEGNAEGEARGISWGLGLYFTVYPYLSHTTDILNYNFCIVLGEQYLKSWFSVFIWQLGIYFPVYSQLYWEWTVKYTPSSTGSIFSSTLPELDLYGKILPSWLSNTGELNFNIIMFSNWELPIYLLML